MWAGSPPPPPGPKTVRGRDINLPVETVPVLNLSRRADWPKIVDRIAPILERAGKDEKGEVFKPTEANIRAFLQSEKNRRTYKIIEKE
jgi:hypothetical protein